MKPKFKVLDVIIGKTRKEHIAVVLEIKQRNSVLLNVYKLLWIGKEDTDSGKIAEYDMFFIDESFELFEG